ncbi:VacB/RNase II family 3'-5' exoribonuclease [Microbulbifer discodermiae]|uniref:VacB/RNase II family 3'-5' exoribonuclease n=1 Tax=Microbulbifer sp. 2201CG32-9 TaxID=3232309 RepID=UPI00345BC518
MLNADALKQLSKLKTDIRSNKDFVDGRVRGSNGKFGFVTLDDGREAFLPPAEMERVFPGDRVRASVTEDDKGRLSAELDQLLESEFKFLVGTYVQRGQGHFIQPSHNNLDRWIFLPPRARGKARPGEYIACVVSRHPFKDGKAQARVESVIGRPETAGIEHALVVAQHRLPEKFSDAALKQVGEIQGKLDALLAERKDLSQLGFVTIDAETTRDMDDAIAVSQRDGGGWTLHIAVADPSSLIEPGSPLDREAFARAHSQYLPGETLPMLPADLCENTFSLLAGQLRPVLLLQIEVSEDGSLGESSFDFVAIRAQHKLSYDSVSSFIGGDQEAVPEEARAGLHGLALLSEARSVFRASHSLVMEDRPDYEIHLDEQRKIARIERQERNVAQRMVEEAMLAGNIAVGTKLAEMQQGCFSVHLGFREERMGEVKSLLRELLPQYAEQDLHQLPNYLALVKQLEASDAAEMRNLLAVLKRMLRPGQLHNQPGVHLGLGLAAYATVTSPIRKYNDLHNHRVLRAAAEGAAAKTLTDEEIDTLQENLVRGRQANRALEQWLYCQFLQDQVGREFAGVITLVNGVGLGVRLDENGVDGFVRLNGNKKKLPEFDGKHLLLTHGGRKYHLEQPVKVKIASVDVDRRRIALNLVSEDSAAAQAAGEEPLAETGKAQ